MTKHGLAGVLQADNPEFGTLHVYFLDHLLPACRLLLTRRPEQARSAPTSTPTS